MPKGTAQWKPHNRMEVVSKKEGYGYRFLHNEPGNLEAKLSEGWVIPNKTNGLAGEFLEDKDQASGGKKHKELILAVMDNETIAARNAYFQEKNDAAIRGIKRQLKGDLQSSVSNAVAHGEVKIERHGAAEVIQ